MWMFQLTQKSFCDLALVGLLMRLYVWLLSHRFTVNRRISIVGFGLYGSIHGPTDYQVNIQVHSTVQGTAVWWAVNLKTESGVMALRRLTSQCLLPYITVCGLTSQCTGPMSMCRPHVAVRGLMSQYPYVTVRRNTCHGTDLTAQLQPARHA